MRTKEFYSFMVKRENIRLRKEAKEPWPWTEDKILQTYKFTNVKREHDRTTKWMRNHWTRPNELAVEYAAFQLRSIPILWNH